jgi:hypothetical protein
VVFTVFAIAAGPPKAGPCDERDLDVRSHASLASGRVETADVRRWLDWGESARKRPAAIPIHHGHVAGGHPVQSGPGLLSATSPGRQQQLGAGHDAVDRRQRGPGASLSLAVNSGGGAVITFNGGLNNLWAISGTVTGGFSAPTLIASGAGSNHYDRIGTSQVALNNAGKAAVVWTVLGGHTGVLTRSPSGATRSPSPPTPPASAPAADHTPAWPT